MSTPEKKAALKQKVAHEARELLAITAFLASFLVSITTYRRLLLAEYHVGYFEYGYAVVESFVLAKVILIGQAMGLGERFQDKPLVYSTLHNTLVFGLLVAVFTLLEHFAGALVHGRPLADALPELAGDRGYEMLSRVVMMLIAFVPLFAIRSVARALGEGKLSDLFFRSGAPARPAEPGR